MAVNKYKYDYLLNSLRINDAAEFNNDIDNINQKITNLEENETIYQLYEYLGTSTSGQITLPSGSTIFDIYGDGLLDAIMVEADENNRPTELNSYNSIGEIVQVTTLDNDGNYVLDSTPTANACILYYIRIEDVNKSNVDEDKLVAPGVPLNQNPFGLVRVATSNADFNSVKDACDYVETQASMTYPFLIEVIGSFSELPITIPINTKLDLRKATITAIDHNNPLITIDKQSQTLRGGTFIGPNNNDGIYVSGATASSVKDVVIVNCGGNAISINDTTTNRFLIRNATMLNNGDGVYVNNSYMVITTSTIENSDVSISLNNNSKALIGNLVNDKNNIDLQTLDDLSTIKLANCTIDNDKLDIFNFNNIQLSYTSSKEGDRATEHIEEIHIGIPEKGFESVFGEGESYTRGMLVYTYDTIGGFVDISTEARSITESTFTYTNNTVNNAIYVASSLNNGIDKLHHHGIKTIITSGSTGGEVVIEYYNGSDWVEFNGFESQASGQFLPHAKQYFQYEGDHQIRYDLLIELDSWIKYDPVGYGTDLYWVRYRIISSPTQLPIIEQFKLHTSRTEINADGFIELFGLSRSYSQLPINLGNAKPIAGNMQNQSIYVAQDVGIGFQQNKFTTTTDILGFNFVLPFETDTSTPLIVNWGGLPSQADTIEWQVQLHVHAAGNTLYTTNPTNTPTTTVTVSGTTTTGISNTFSALLDISDAITRRTTNEPGDLIWVTIQPITLNGTFTLIGIVADYAKWCIGGHL